MCTIKPRTSATLDISYEAPAGGFVYLTENGAAPLPSAVVMVRPEHRISSPHVLIYD